jgi:hypothetical protein
VFFITYWLWEYQLLTFFDYVTLCDCFSSKMPPSLSSLVTLLL